MVYGLEKVDYPWEDAVVAGVHGHAGIVDAITQVKPRGYLLHVVGTGRKSSTATTWPPPNTALRSCGPSGVDRCRARPWLFWNRTGCW